MSQKAEKRRAGDIVQHIVSLIRTTAEYTGDLFLTVATGSAPGIEQGFEDSDDNVRWQFPRLQQTQTKHSE
eukprot:9203065-Pyramimonas_sp.AAC.1